MQIQSAKIVFSHVSEGLEQRAISAKDRPLHLTFALHSYDHH